MKYLALFWYFGWVVVFLNVCLRLPLGLDYVFAWCWFMAIYFVGYRAVRGWDK